MTNYSSTNHLLLRQAANSPDYIVNLLTRKIASDTLAKIYHKLNKQAA